jgi:hypothetical protein
MDLLTRERPRLDRLAAALLQAETLDGADAYPAAGLPVPGRRALPGSRYAETLTAADIPTPMP